MAGIFSEVNAFFDLMSKVLNAAGTIRNTLYRNAQDTSLFDSQVESLRRQEVSWDLLLKRHGPRARQLVRDSLGAAIKDLEREVARFNHRQANCWLRWNYKTLTVENANWAIQNVFKAFEDIPQKLRVFDEADQILNRATTSDLAALPFQSDKKYVPLQNTSTEVQRALEAPGGPPVVTLYGEPGSGKSTLAKYLALYYDELRSQGKRNVFADGVFFLACGPDATSKALHVELWQNLGFRAVFNPQSQETDPSFMDSRVSDEQTYSEAMLHKQLMGRLVGRSVLIILDDVSETRLLERLLLPGKGLKYLVTTQYKRVWEDAVQIRIARPSLKEARQILVNHVVGLPAGEKELPVNLQDIANDMILASESNPLVLANFALTISSERATNVEEWITAKKYLLVPLDNKDKGPVVFGQTYPQTVASSMTMAVNSMTQEAKNLLFLAALCDGQAVPETVLKVLFKGLHGNLERFQKWSNYLEDRAFIHIETHPVKWTDVPERTWSLHRLRKYFVLEKMKNEVSAMVTQLHCGVNQSDADIVSALYFLFASKSWPHEGAAARFGISTETSDFSRRSIMPFVGLLHVDGDEEWRSKSYQIAKKIIVDYLFTGGLDDGGLSQLLEIQEAQPATCWALETIAALEQKTLLTEKHATLKILLGLLGQAVDPSIQSSAAVALGALAFENHKIIMAQPLFLKQLLGLLKGSLAVNYNVQLYAAWTLGNLASTSDSKRIISSDPAILNGLVMLLNRDDYHYVQREAAYALRRLAYYGEPTDPHSKRTRLIALPGMLEKLVELLGRDVDPELQKEVLWLLGNLAVSHEDKVTIRDQPGVLHALVGILSKEARFDTQRYSATYALRRLTLKIGDSALLGIPNALERLMALLVDDLRPDEQQEAARCLSFLTYPEEYRMMGLAGWTGLVKGFVSLLGEHVSPTTQLIAIGTLANLAEAEENKILVASEPGAIHGLVGLLVKYGYTSHEQESEQAVVELAVRCLGQLATANNEVLLSIAATAGAVPGLVKLLGNREIRSSKVKQTAAWILNSLAEAIIDENQPIDSDKLQANSQMAASAMMTSVDSMTKEAKTLLFLAAVCDGPSVPETVIKVLFNCLHGSLANFQMCSDYLTDNAFIEIETQVIERSDVPHRSWSVHGLGQLFMIEKKRDEVRAMLSRLDDSVHKDTDIVSALYFLFSAKSWTDEDIIQMAGISAGTCDYNKSSIKPFVWLLHPEDDEEWECKCHESVKKIIIGYVSHGELDDTGLSTLLEMSQVQTAACWALEATARLEQRPLLNKTHLATLRSLIGLLGDALHPNIQSWGTVALGALASRNHKMIIAQPFALEQLLRMLKGNLAVDDNVQVNAAWALGNLAATFDSKQIIARYPGILAALIVLLQADEYPDVQRETVYALKRLAYGKPNDQNLLSEQTRIIAIPGLVQKLVDLMERSQDPEMLKEVVWLLGNLAVSHEDKIFIRAHSGVLPLLVGMISREGKFDTQRYHAVYALRRLTLMGGDAELLRTPHALERLVALLVNNLQPNEQQGAVHCLSCFAYPLETRIELAAIPGVVKGLIGLLHDDVNPSTKLIAAETLADLVQVYENKSVVASEPDAIQHLVNLLEINQELDLLTQSEIVEVVVRCLGWLAFEHHENQVTLAGFPGALEGLLELLDHPAISSSQVQQVSAWALRNLAAAEETRSQIRAFPSAVPKLTQLAARSSDPDVQWYAQSVLKFLTSCVDMSKDGFESKDLRRHMNSNGGADHQNVRKRAPKYVLYCGLWTKCINLNCTGKPSQS